MAELRELRATSVTNKDLAFFATKSELTDIDSKVTAQAEEISQLRLAVNTQEDRLKQVEETISKHTIELATRSNRLPEAESDNVNKYGDQPRATDASTRRMNIVLHGAKKGADNDLIAYVIALGDSIGVFVYKEEIRLATRTSSSARPPPVLVSFVHPFLRDSFLRNKFNLPKTEKYSDIYINADEPTDVRRRNGLYRRVAAAAREDGKLVIMRQDWIGIGDDIFGPTDLGKIPLKYMPRDFLAASNERPSNVEMQDCRVPILGPNQSKPSSPKIPEEIRLTKAGIIFSGETAFLSNKSRAEFVYDGTPYTSTEQGFHHLGAAHHLDFDLAEKILKEQNTTKIKTLSHDYPRSLEWERIGPHKLYKLNKEKYRQNPELLAKLVATAPHRLIEASVDQRWGGAAPYSSGIYDQGIVPGRNLFGDKLTSLRDEFISQDMISI